MRAFHLLAVSAAAILTLSACGGSESSSASRELTESAPASTLASAPAPEPADDLTPADQFDAAACPTDQGYEGVLDCYLAGATQSLDSWWTAAFAAADGQYSSPGVQSFGEAVSTGCGDAAADTGPFYCGADQTIYLQSDFMARIGDETGAEGPYSGVIVLAHEWAHHIQALMGMDEEFDAAAAEELGSVNAASTRTELMADCMAGWWAGMANETGQFPATEQDLLDAVLALAEVGDDFQSAIAGADFEPDTWDHGTLDQRTTWLTNGMQAGADDANPFEACDTFTITTP